MSDTHSHIHCTWPWEMCELMRWQEINVKMQKAIAKLMGLNLTILMQSTKLNLKIWQCSDRSELGKSLEDVWSLIHKRGQLEHVQTFTSKSSDQRISKLFPLSLYLYLSIREFTVHAARASCISGMPSSAWRPAFFEGFFCMWFMGSKYKASTESHSHTGRISMIYHVFFSGRTHRRGQHHD